MMNVAMVRVIMVITILMATRSLSGSTISAKMRLQRTPHLMSPGRELFPLPLVDPETKESLKGRTRVYGFVEERFLESTDGARYLIKPQFIDMTLEEIKKPFWEISNRERVSSRFFQNPLLSTIYERGYRQNFQNAGFPGPELESKEAIDFFAPSGEETVVDLSCGSGFMSRLFTKSGRFGNVVSADLSPNMLEETRRRFLEEGLTPSYTVRVDSAKLPFKDASVDFLHAGAAMHCWPRLPEALSEVHRVLKPGGKFFASTFFRTIQGTPMAIKRATRGTASNGGMYMFDDEEEINSLLSDAGFAGATGEALVRREGRGCAIVKCTKAD